MNRRTAVIVLALALAAGCGEGAFDDDGGGGGGRSDADAPLDAGAFEDAGARIDGGVGSDRERFAGLSGATEGSAPAGFEDMADPTPGTCVDGDDNDMDGTLDCDEDSCSGVGACCVGSGNCCEERGRWSNALPDCPDLGACGMTAFGSPLAYVDDRGLSPGGDEDFDSGAVLAGEIYDARRHRVDIEATFEGVSDCGASCLESVAVALTAQESFGEATHVDPEAGLVLSGSRGQVGLLLAGEVVTWMETEPGTRWSLAAKPSGTVVVERDPGDGPVTVAEHGWVPRDGLRLVTYGRTRNLAGDETSARLTELTVRRSLCDEPSAWDARDGLAIVDGDGAEITPIEPTSPDIEAGDERVWLTWSEGGDIHLAERDGDDPTRFVRAGEAIASGSSPALLWNAPEAQWELFYEQDGAMRRMVGPSPQDLEPAAVSVLSPFRSIGEPAVVAARGSRGETTWVMAVRAVTAGGFRQLALFWSANGTRYRHVGSGDLSALSSSNANDGIAQGWDDIGEPTLVRFHDSWHMYYERRRGTRASTGIVASHELLWWRDAGGALAAGDELDRVAVGAPSALTSADLVELYYVAHDGTRARLARARRAAADGM